MHLGEVLREKRGTFGFGVELAPDNQAMLGMTGVAVRAPVVRRTSVLDDLGVVFVAAAPCEREASDEDQRSERPRNMAGESLSSSECPPPELTPECGMSPALDM